MGAVQRVIVSGIVPQPYVSVYVELAVEGLWNGSFGLVCIVSISE